MRKIIMLALIGLVAQLIDGSLGMAYGVTSTTLLLWYGLSPALASASVHLAEVVTAGASGLSHWKFGNVDRRIVKKLVIPGSLGAFSGAALLSSIPAHLAKPFISIFLLSLGVYVILRFVFFKKQEDLAKENHTAELPVRKWYTPLGFFAGLLDATGGGGWGPITTPVLLSQKGMKPNKVIGSVNFSEFAVALSASVGFFIFIGFESLQWQIVVFMMLGGVIAAPIAAYIVKKMRTELLGVLAGGLIILTNLRTILKEFAGVSVGEPQILLPLLLIWLLLIVRAVRKG
ncbi:sulfite exporter TauE/SafE family protein [Fictibacillus iocasae]|uniref:Probable membrane transporter protein n=1 Tax=Fictibacillus iocasae TaxID=2715437 RepID=A0ABW2NV37_9BACL